MSAFAGRTTVRNHRPASIQVDLPAWSRYIDAWCHPPIATLAPDPDAAFDRHHDLNGVMLMRRSDTLAVSQGQEAAVPQIPMSRAGPPRRRGDIVRSRFIQGHQPQHRAQPLVRADSRKRTGSPAGVI